MDFGDIICPSCKDSRHHGRLESRLLRLTEEPLSSSTSSAVLLLLGDSCSQPHPLSNLSFLLSNDLKRGWVRTRRKDPSTQLSSLAVYLRLMIP